MRGLEAVGLGLNSSFCPHAGHLPPPHKSQLPVASSGTRPWPLGWAAASSSCSQDLSVFLLCPWPHCVGTVSVRILQPWALPEGHHRCPAPRTVPGTWADDVVVPDVAGGACGHRLKDPGAESVYAWRARAPVPIPSVLPRTKRARGPSPSPLIGVGSWNVATTGWGFSSLWFAAVPGVPKTAPGGW